MHMYIICTYICKYLYFLDFNKVNNNKVIKVKFFKPALFKS